MCISVELDSAFDCAEKINVYKDGAVTVYGAGDKAFKEILVSWKSMIDGAHIMPAFGVSIGRETRKELNKGVWVEFEFKETYAYNEMPFEKLLINMQEGFSGFNLIRYNSDRGYDGRCFYYSLVGKDSTDFYNLLIK